MMEYLLKTSALIAVFYIFYFLLLKKETFYNFNRIFLISGIIMSIILPLIIIPVYIHIRPESIENIYSVINSSGSFANTKSLEVGKKLISNSLFNFKQMIQMIYLIGVIIFSIRFFLSLIRIVFSPIFNSGIKKNGYYLIEIKDNITPFSFMNRIVYNPQQFTQEELSYIIQHELTHIKQWHSIDILFVNLFLIFNWFNPFAYLYKHILIQNLEYLADSHVKTDNTQKYELLLLKTILSNHRLKLVNNFFRSPIKNRIIMINITKSNSNSKYKYLLLIPIIAFFLYSCSTKKIQIVDAENLKAQQILTESNNDSSINNTNEYKAFTLPIEENKYTFGSTYGERIHPVLNVKKFHAGIDLKAKTGTNIMAVMNGKVLKSDYNENDGNFILLQHKNGYKTKYTHLNVKKVNEGDTVEQNQIIGTVGNTGKSTGSHLHFEVSQNNKNIDPALILPSNNIFTDEKIHDIIVELFSGKYIYEKPDGTTFSFDKLTDKVVLLDFTSKNLPQIYSEMLNIDYLVDKYKNHEFQLVGINIGVDKDEWRKYIEKKEFKSLDIFAYKFDKNPLTELNNGRFKHLTLDNGKKITYSNINGFLIDKSLNVTTVTFNNKIKLENKIKSLFNQ